MNQGGMFSNPDIREKYINPPQVTVHALEDDGVIPNNKALPLLIYQAALKLPEKDPATIFEAVFAANRWGNSWRNGIFPFHHYHSTAHEVLGIATGEAEVQFGGKNGVVRTVRPGDVVAIPAGVGHKNLGFSRDLCVVGAYPPGKGWDLCYGKPEERPQVLEDIARVALPLLDPVYGEDGPLMAHWRQPG